MGLVTVDIAWHVLEQLKSTDDHINSPPRRPPSDVLCSVPSLEDLLPSRRHTCARNETCLGSGCNGRSVRHHKTNTMYVCTTTNFLAKRAGRWVGGDTQKLLQFNDTCHTCCCTTSTGEELVAVKQARSNCFSTGGNAAVVTQSGVQIKAMTPESARNLHDVHVLFLGIAQVCSIVVHGLRVVSYACNGVKLAPFTINTLSHCRRNLVWTECTMRVVLYLEWCECAVSHRGTTMEMRACRLTAKTACSVQCARTTPQASSLTVGTTHFP